MSLTINSQSPELGLLNVLSRLNQQQSLAMLRLATAKRINSAADDPAGLIAATMFSHEIQAVDAAINNASKADAMLNVADGAMAQVSSLLTEISTLATAAAGDSLTDAEKAANQMQIDQAIEAIDRIVGTTTFDGHRLLDGSYAIRTSMSGADAAKIKDVEVSVRPSNATSASFVVNVSSAATKASTATSGWVDMSGGNTTLSAQTILTITGQAGTTSLTLAAGADRATVMSAINGVAGLTGVTATASGTAIRLESQNYGAEAIISVSVLSGDQDFVSQGQISRLTGSDAVVTVNGASASVDGRKVYWSGNGYAMSFTLADNTTGTRTITVTDGGATYQLGTDANTQATLGINGLYSVQLGQYGVGYLSDLKSGGSATLDRDPAAAANIARQALTQVASTAAKLGGFQKYQVQSAFNALSKTKEGLSEARSAIEDADIASETANLSRLNMLIDTTTSLFGVVNQQRQSLLSLLWAAQ